jgi:transcriptional regulator of acetoin/glycerol metabolism
VSGAALKDAPELAPAARAWLLAHRWPGNLRELRNVIEYARTVCSQGYIELGDLPDTPGTAAAPQALAPRTAAATSEATQLLQQLRAARWNVTAVARQLGISRMTLYRRMKRWGISSPNQRDDQALP